MTASFSDRAKRRDRRRFASQTVDRSTVWGSVFLVQHAGDGDVNLRGDVHVHPSLPRHYDALLNSAHVLAASVRSQEAEGRARLLADIADPKAADLAFQRAQLDLQWREDEGPHNGSLNSISAFYTALTRGRLVVLGDAGAGKTVLAMQLVIDTIDVQAGMPPDPGRLIPVRLSCSSFEDTRLSSPDITPATTAALLDEWIVRELSNGAHPLKRRQAKDLVQAGWVLPILDGLDEMDTEGGQPARALAVIRALNSAGGHGRQPVVVTCRASLYDRLQQAPQTHPGDLPVLQDAAVVTLQQLDTVRIKRHLAYRFPRRPRQHNTGSSDEVEERWRPVVDHIAHHSDSPLASLLRSPLWLFVAVAGYYQPHTRPEELIYLPAAQLRDFLLARLLPETVAQHRRKDPSYSEPEVRKCLGTLSRHLATEHKHGHSATDLQPHHLWRAAGHYVPRILTAATHTVLTALFLLIALSHYHSKTSYWIPPYAPGRALLLAGFLAVIAVAVRTASRPLHLRRLDTAMLNTASGRLRALATLACVAASGAAGYLFGLWYSQDYGPRVGQAYGLSFLSVGLVLATEITLARRPPAVSRPSLLMSRALAFQATILVSYGLFLSIGFGWMNFAAYPWLTWSAFTDGAVLGLCLGLAIGLARTCGSPWPRYAIAVAILIARRRLPLRRLGPLLDWLYEAGLLRLSGTAIQFRHSALQTWIRRIT
ncbi:NACHT domain-containing protein [Streptomyces sp. NPDC004227]